jgi:hypothetical protein
MCQVIAAFARQHVILTYFPTQDPITEHEVTSLANPAGACGGPDGVSLYSFKSAHFTPNLLPAYHYAVFAHYNTCETDGTASNQCGSCPANSKTNQPPGFATTGVSEVPGNDFIVSLGYYWECGSPPTDAMNAGTFMHELGHNLGLHHGGSTDPAFGGNATDGDLTQKPNYSSIMNYNYQLTGIGTGPLGFASSLTDPSTFYRVDYSSNLMGTLSEGMLQIVGGVSSCVSDGSGGINESIGVSGPTTDTDVVAFYSAGGSQENYGASNGARIDFDADGDTGPTTGDAAVYADVNGDGQCNVLHGYNDWQHTTVGSVTTMQHLRIGFQCNTGNWADGAGLVDSLSTNELTGPYAQSHNLSYPFLRVTVSVRQTGNSHISPGGTGSVPVVAYGSATFNVAQVVTSSLRFAGAPATSVSYLDVNGDGFMDLQGIFPNAQISLPPGATSASLRGVLLSSQLCGGDTPVTLQ